jgi:hypothetical protein
MRGGGDHLVGRRALLVLLSERRGRAAAGGRDHGKASRDDRSRGGHVPGVRKYEMGAGAVQRPQQLALILKISYR